MSEQTKLAARLNRLIGQLERMKGQVETGDCAEVVPQLLATRGALNSFVKVYLETKLAECGRNDKQKLEELIGMLIKYS